MTIRNPGLLNGDALAEHDDPPVPRGEASVLWSDARLLGFAPMDETHREFYAVAFELLTCTAAEALAALDAFEAHATAHFSQEEEWMSSTGFSPSDCHVNEHAAVLRAVRDVRAGVIDGQGDVGAVHDLAAQLLQWFPGHADYLDSALAAWMSRHLYGGKPIVLRRGIC